MLPHTQTRASMHTNSGTATPQAQGSSTQTISRSDSPDSLVLRLRGAQHHAPRRTQFQTRSRSRSTTPESDTAESSASQRQRPRRSIQWAADVVDNEGLGRKKSKVCCIYHKSREVGESSSEDDSSSSSSSDSDSDSEGSEGSGVSDDGAARMAGRRGKAKGGSRRSRRQVHGHKHEHEHGEGADCGDPKSARGRRKPSPNAYEKMPKYDVPPLKGQVPVPVLGS